MKETIQKKPTKPTADKTSDTFDWKEITFVGWITLGTKIYKQNQTKSQHT